MQNKKQIRIKCLQYNSGIMKRCKQWESISKEHTFKKNKNYRSDRFNCWRKKKSLDRLNSRLNIAKEKFSEMEETR